MAGADARETTQLTRAQIAALRRWPKVLALSLTHGGKPTVTWKQFCDAQDRYEEVLREIEAKCFFGSAKPA